MKTKIGLKMLELQDKLARQYKYKTLPPLIAKINMGKYIETLPDEFYDDKVWVLKNKPGIIIDGKPIALYSEEGTKIANKYSRVVIGHYGAFLEIDPADMCMDNIKCKEGQEYRMNNADYKDRVKYFWFTAKDNSDCKIYFQQREVTYADYKPNMYYISPFEVETKGN